MELGTLGRQSCGKQANKQTNRRACYQYHNYNLLLHPAVTFGVEPTVEIVATRRISTFVVVVAVVVCVFFNKLFISPPPLCFKSVYLPTATPHLPTPHCTRLSKALGAAAQHLMQWTRPPDADTKGLYLAVHADTDQEWSDHTLRSDINNINDSPTSIFGLLEDIDGE